MSPAKPAKKPSKAPTRAKAAPRKAAKKAGRKAAKPARKGAPKAAKRAAGARPAPASVRPGHARCAATDPFGDPCQNVPRRPSAYCVIHSYLDR